MAVTYDKQRKQWVARFTFNGKRIYVGRYPTKKIAEVALATYEKRLKKMEATTVETYRVDFEQTDQSLVRRMINRIKAKRAERRKDKQTTEKLEAL